PCVSENRTWAPVTTRQFRTCGIEIAGNWIHVPASALTGTSVGSVHDPKHPTSTRGLIAHFGTYKNGEQIHVLPACILRIFEDDFVLTRNSTRPTKVVIGGSHVVAVEDGFAPVLK